MKLVWNDKSIGEDLKLVYIKIIIIMDSSSDEEDVVVYRQYRRLRKARRMYWVHPYIEKNIKCRLFVAAAELKESDAKFISLYRMSKSSYQYLLQLILPYLMKRNTNMRECVSGEESLLITLRYLGTEHTFASLALYFAKGDNTIGSIVKQCTKVIWNVLNKKYMHLPKTEDLKRTAERFEYLWNLPNCIGALDGKHVRIEKFGNTGSENFNYKYFHSVVLLACCNADGLFTMVETGYAGRNSDGGIFQASAIKHWITHGGNQLPSPLTHDVKKIPFPYYLVGDEAFPLTHYLMRPYPKRTLNNVKRIFNYILSRGRKTIECGFGMASEKFQVLNGPILCHDLQTVTDIIKAVCVLHNFVRNRDGIEYTSANIQHAQRPSNDTLIPAMQSLAINDNSSPTALRNYLANYFLSPQACLA